MLVSRLKGITGCCLIFQRSLMITLRLFKLGKERISFRKLSKLEDPSLSDEWRNQFPEIRRQLNEFLEHRDDRTNDTTDGPDLETIRVLDGRKSVEVPEQLVGAVEQKDVHTLVVTAGL